MEATHLHHHHDMILIHADRLPEAETPATHAITDPKPLHPSMSLMYNNYTESLCRRMLGLRALPQSRNS
jgi:hypothetical protein